MQWVQNKTNFELISTYLAEHIHELSFSFVTPLCTQDDIDLLFPRRLSGWSSTTSKRKRRLEFSDFTADFPQGRGQVLRGSPHGTGLLRVGRWCWFGGRGTGFLLELFQWRRRQIILASGFGGDFRVLFDGSLCDRGCPDDITVHVGGGVVDAANDASYQSVDRVLNK
jgi:hypothetical protein